MLSLTARSAFADPVPTMSTAPPAGLTIPPEVWVLTVAPVIPRPASAARALAAPMSMPCSSLPSREVDAAVDLRDGAGRCGGLEREVLGVAVAVAVVDREAVALGEQLLGRLERQAARVRAGIEEELVAGGVRVGREVGGVDGRQRVEGRHGRARRLGRGRGGGAVDVPDAVGDVDAHGAGVGRRAVGERVVEPVLVVGAARARLREEREVAVGLERVGAAVERRAVRDRRDRQRARRGVRVGVVGEDRAGDGLLRACRIGRAVGRRRRPPAPCCRPPAGRP